MSAPSSCRLCLRNNNLIRLLTRRMKSRDILGKIRKHFQLEINYSDGHSTYICTECLKKVEDFHLFYTEVQNNQELLATNFKQEDIDSIKDDDELENEILNTEINESHSSVDFAIKQESQLSIKTTDLIDETNNGFECRMEVEEEMVNHPKPIDEKGETFKWKNDDFPNLIENGKLLFRGQELTDLMSKFYVLNCELCPSSRPKYKCLTNLMDHYDKIHSVKGYVSCCGIKIINRDRMAYHMAYHVQPEVFTCTVCNKVFKSPNTLEVHQKNHLPESERPLLCPSCPRRFSYPNSLSEHLFCHLPDSEHVAHICPKCGKSFISNARMKSHMSSVHIDQTIDHVCTVCGRKFTLRARLVTHMLTHEPHANQEQCKICDKWFKNRNSLNKHTAQVHSTVRYQCKLCEYSAVTQLSLRDHERNRHSNIKPFGCEHCDKSFKLKKHLANHIGTHTGEKRYVCEFCNQRFISTSNYYGHRKRVHPKELAEQLARKAAEDQILRGKCMANKT